jgi:hypothetical protein
MSIEKKIEKDIYGRNRYVLESDKVIKIGDKLLCVRLIQIEKWKERFSKNPSLTSPMPRAKFVKEFDNPYYLIRKSDLKELQQKIKGEK